MSRMKKRIHATLYGPPLDPKQRPLLHAAGEQDWNYTVGDSLTSTLLTGSTGSGKTTKLKTILLAMMRARFGGLSLIVKGNLTGHILDVARMAGRESDLIVLNESTGHCYNPFELTRNAPEGAVMVAEVAKTLHAGHTGGASEDDFWKELRDVQLRALCRICLHAHGTLSMPLLSELFLALPLSPTHAKDPEWQRSSRAWAHLKAAMETGGDEVRHAAHKLLNRPSAADSRLQDSINALITVTLDRMASEPLNRVFGTQSTFTMDDILNRQKILVIDMPVLDSDSGRIANLVVQHCFMKATTKIPRHMECFMLCDEFHHTVTPEFGVYLSHQREALVAPILAIQNLLLLEERIGKTGAEALCGNAVTKIFCRQDDPSTNDWASKLIGKGWKWRYSDSRDAKGARSTSSHKEYDFHIQPDEFTRMGVEEAIVLNKGAHRKTHWSETPGGSGGTVRIAAP